MNAMNQMKVVKSRGAVWSCWRLGARPPAMLAAVGPISAPSVNFCGLTDDGHRRLPVPSLADRGHLYNTILPSVWEGSDLYPDAVTAHTSSHLCRPSDAALR